jgi:hypothetical protein
MVSTKARKRSKVRSVLIRDEPAEILAWAWAGMMVFVPSPTNPPQMPFTSSVGRAPFRSRTVYPVSPTSAGTPMEAWYAASSNGSAASAARSVSVRATTSS